jgi:hypothetical protein
MRKILGPSEQQISQRRTGAGGVEVRRFKQLAVGRTAAASRCGRERRNTLVVGGA